MKKTKLTFAILSALLLFLAGCTNRPIEEAPDSQVVGEPFGNTQEGEQVQIFTLTNRNSMKVKITNFGGIITSIEVPDKDGNNSDVVLGFDNLESYLSGHPLFGALVGRFGNRIANAKFTIDGVEYELAQNNGKNHIHGGIKGFDKVVWNAETTLRHESPSLKLTYQSKDGEEGYPGNLDVVVYYTLNDNNELIIDYEAETDKPTHVNLTNHSYFNLNPERGDVLGHILEIKAEQYTVMDENLIPTGELAPVEGTALDFRDPKPIGKDIASVGLGYDHNFVFSKSGTNLELVAKAIEPESGRFMEVFTTQPGVQLYTGNHLNGKLTGSSGIVYRKHMGFCLETQHFPDTPNQPAFPSTILRPGEKYHQTTIYRFGAE